MARDEAQSLVEGMRPYAFTVRRQLDPRGTATAGVVLDARHQGGADSLAAQPGRRAYCLDLAVEPAVGRQHAHPGDLRAADDRAVELPDEKVLVGVGDDLRDGGSLSVG